ncbi:hypothetical protein HWV62_26622 [Athelia sp. TMB]|nr:hypothetical protein HWV62_26622 [Athelia sp. TMB]
MEFSPKLVYRALIQVSHYTINGFYDQVHVEGAENVSAHAPLVVASTHHNEIIDIATLGVTIPHARHLSFWAKSSLFANPLLSGILSSSGAIPVHRNPNAIPGPSSAQSSQESLFRSTTLALEKHEAVGVFPEGTSYTEPGIVQVKDGAAWAAVEYAKAMTMKGKEKEAVEIVPVAIVYSDKTRYRSRIAVRYGTSIFIPPLSPGGDPRAAVKQLTSEIREALLRMSVNAPDWDTLNAAKAALEILSEGAEVPMSDWVGVMQTLISLLTSTPASPTSHTELKRTLVAYFGLLHNTGISHASLDYLLPPVSPTDSGPPPLSMTRLMRPYLRLLHPRTLLFIPPMLVFLPGYVLGGLAGHYLAVGPASPPPPKPPLGDEVVGEKKQKKAKVETATEEESKAQYKAIVGGMGVTFGCYLAGRLVLSSLIRFGLRLRAPAFGSAFVSALFATLGLRNSENSNWAERIGSALDGASEWVRVFGAFLGATGGNAGSSALRGLGKLGVMYATGWAIIKWHNRLVGWNKATFNHILASCKLALSLASAPVPQSALAQYLVPPRPAISPYIKRDVHAAAPQRPKPVPARKLMQHLLRARGDATRVLGAYLGNLEKIGEESAHGVQYLREWGLGVPQCE